ncbi:hypothetical protein ACOME3_003445 [Neoechinorhynchus agilis]
MSNLDIALDDLISRHQQGRPSSSRRRISSRQFRDWDRPDPGFNRPPTSRVRRRSPIYHHPLNRNYDYDRPMDNTTRTFQAFRTSQRERRWVHDLYERRPDRYTASRRHRSRSPLRSQSERTRHSRQSIIVSNLHHRVSEDDLRDLFSEFGVIGPVRMSTDSAGRSLGSAVITFEHRRDALQALAEYRGAVLDGRPLHVIMDDADDGRRRIHPPARGPRFSERTTRSTAYRKRMTAEELDRQLDEYMARRAENRRGQTASMATVGRNG